MPLSMDWGPEGTVITVTAEDFQKKSMKIFGYDYTSPKLKGLRDLFKNLQIGYFYRLNTGGTQAKGDIAQAKYPGVRGNDLTVAVNASVDEKGAFDVITYINAEGVQTVIDKQHGKDWADIKDNDFVTFIRTAPLAQKAGVKLTGGTNGSEITGTQYQEYISAIEPYYFNTLGYVGTDSTTQDLFVQFVKRMRNNVGAKFQVILYGKEDVDFEGVISIKNAVTDKGESPASLVYWLTGAEASCAVNASCTNKTYDGEYTVSTEYSQPELEKALVSGMLTFHRVADPASGDIKGKVAVLDDINTFTSFTKEKNVDFSLNQVIRVLDQIAIDVSRLFNRTYLGKEQNDHDGRVALWGDVVFLHQNYQKVRAIQNFDEKDIEIPQQGDDKRSVVMTYQVQPTCCMEKLYLTVVVA